MLPDKSLDPRSLHPNLDLLVVTPGEPAGIGPDCVLMAAQRSWAFPWCVVADPQLLRARAQQLHLPVRVVEWSRSDLSHCQPNVANTLFCLPRALQAPCIAGELNPANAGYVLDCLDIASELCLQNVAAALVTGPIHKSVINDAGFVFSGHTEWLAQKTGAPAVVMCLATDTLRIALVTTHLPLRAVASAITQKKLEQTLRLVQQYIQTYFTQSPPCIRVLGLNPHAGENGHLGDEEITTIVPVIQRLRAEGLNIQGPVSADTAFTDTHRVGVDVFVAMYHDQGLPVIKQNAFGHAINITLGLPIIRTSVDHGTALSLAGTGRADPAGLITALTQAYAIATRVRKK